MIPKILEFVIFPLIVIDMTTLIFFIFYEINTGKDLNKIITNLTLIAVIITFLGWVLSTIISTQK